MRNRVGIGLLIGIVAIVAVAVGYRMGNAFEVPPATTSVVREAPTPAVLTQVRALSRLETAQFHMERAIALTHEQERLWGLVRSEDKLLLLAAANISAGVDLAQLTPEDVVVDSATREVTIRLPRAEIFHVALDEEHTFVYTRQTDLLAERHETLETEARQRAVGTLRGAAITAGILRTAEMQAKRTLENLCVGLGFVRVTFVPRMETQG